LDESNDKLVAEICESAAFDTFDIEVCAKSYKSLALFSKPVLSRRDINVVCTAD